MLSGGHFEIKKLLVDDLFLWHSYLWAEKIDGAQQH